MKNIVLLSDGTGNSAGKRNKTNVWRLYQALDLHDRNQIAMYDDGVGTEEFLLPRLLGGAFGWGLSRNVIELYKFLCRNYEKGDKIYLFGFSRGAFTVRILAGLIAMRGLRTGFTSERDLDEFVNQAYYVDYHEEYWQYQITRPIYWLRCWRYRKRKWYKNNNKYKTNIEFIGVWDTVSAYGLPVEEIRILWDKLIYPLRFKNRKLNKKVLKACHALSIDDERLTFHPELWDESKETDPDRIEQVWFPGAHGDVGGGYPHHDLALVSLDWMISKIKNLGLKFRTDLVIEYSKLQNWNGKQHDSRSGFGSLYRYKPRNIEAICRKAESKVLFMLCNEVDNKGKLTCLPKIHRSVFERIKAQVVPYAPTGLPAKYQVVDKICNPATGSKLPTYESPSQARARHLAMNLALDVIFWRCLLYYTFLVVIMAFAAFPVLVAWEDVAPCTSTRISCLLDPVCKLAKAITPGIADYWITALCRNPICALVLFIILVALISAKRYTSAITFDRATSAWSYMKWGKFSCTYTTITSRLRYCWVGNFGKFVRKVWWCLIFLIIVFAILIAVYQTVLYLHYCFDC